MEIPVSHGIYKVTFEVRSPGLHSYKKMIKMNVHLFRWMYSMYCMWTIYIWGKRPYLQSGIYFAAFSDELSQWWADCNCADEAYGRTAGGLTSTDSNKERKSKTKRQARSKVYSCWVKQPQGGCCFKVDCSSK